jgi:DNA-binding HxlR family transcriptional regulator
MSNSITKNLCRNNPKVEFSISEFGLSVVPIIKAMAKWGEEYRMKKQKV